MGLEQRGRVGLEQWFLQPALSRRTSINPPSKPFLIDQRPLYEAYLEVRSKEGAGGVDGVTIEQFEKDLKGNLYKVWKSTEFWHVLPAPCARGDHSEENGGGNILGVSTVGDRVAQTVVKQMIEPDLDQIFLAIPTAIGPTSRRSMLSELRASGAGNTIGS